MTSLPYEQWPEWAKALALLKTDEDKGVGDTAHRLLHLKMAKPLTNLALTTLMTFKKKCGCSERRAEWNLKFKY